MSSKKSTNYNQNTTTTPIVPSFVSSALQNLTQGTEALAGRDPTSFVAPQTDLQKQANAEAAGLGGWTGASQSAEAMAKSAGNAGANLTGPTSLAALPTMAPTALTTAPTVGPAATYGATSYGSSNATGVPGATSTDAASASLLDGGLAKYLNPELQNVVNTSLADFDQNAGQVRAAQAAKGALNDAFGGSRFGIQEGETEGQLARARATEDATLRSQAYNDATNLANEDANRVQQTNLANAGAKNATSQFNSGLFADLGKFNAGQDQSAAAANASAANTAASQNTSAENALRTLQAGLTAAANNQNATATNAQNTDVFNTGADLNKTNAAAQNQQSEFNANQKDTALARALAASGLLSQEANSANTNSINDVLTQAQLGGQQQATNQAIATAPLSLQQAIATLLGQNQFGLLTGQKSNVKGHSETTTSDPLGTVGSILSSIGAIAGAPFTGGASLAGLFAPAAASGFGAGMGSAMGSGMGSALGGLFG